MEKLVIVMTSDKNYIVPIKVAIYSMVRSTKDAFFDIHILCNSKFDLVSREEFNILADKLKRVRIIYDEIDDSQILEAKRLGNISLASYYRLYISRVLNEEKCLFIDGDVIVDADLKEIYNTDLAGYYMAGVRDCGVQARMKDSWEWLPKIGIPDLHNYINAGFILFNLEKIRDEKLDEKFVQAINVGYRYMDQDILNKYCYGKIKTLPLRYNLFSEFYGRTDKLCGTDYTKEEWVDIEDWGLIHYPGIFKPWYCRRLKANKLWWDIAEKILSEEELEKYRNTAKIFEKTSDWDTIWKKIYKEEQIVIFGYSEIGRKLEELLERSNKDFEIVFVDNDIKKQGNKHRGKIVLSAKDATNKYKKAFWIISSQLAHTVIKEQLNNLGVKDEKICRFIYKSDAYYEGLDDDSFEYETEILKINRKN